MCDMEKLLIIAGPTATGKTKLAVTLAKQCNGELINADSRQMYIGFDILSGKDIPRHARPEYKQKITIRNIDFPLVTYVNDGIPIWLYDVVSPDKEVSVAIFRDLARQCITQITERGKLPIIVGGTGYYLSALEHHIDSLNIPPDPHLRHTLADVPLEYLQQKLSFVDDHRWNGMNQSDRANPRRLIRAIEIAEWKMKHQVSHDDSPALDIVTIGLLPDHAEYAAQIRRRVIERMKQGALTEARKMRAAVISPHMQSVIGYPILLRMLDGNISEDEAIKEWTMKELQYAKRQITWFKKQGNIRWYHSNDSTLLSDIQNVVSAWYTTE